MKSNGKKILQKVSVFENLSSPLMFGYNGIDNLGINHLSRSNKFAFQEDLNLESFERLTFK